jgi:hypothetical protein
MGIISKSLAWISHPYNDADSDPVDWFAFFVLTLIVAYIWAKVVRNIVEG